MKKKLFAAVLCAAVCTEALAGGPMRVALVGDPQVDNAVEMGYARRSIYKELAGRRDIDLCLFLGDLVNDDMALLPESVNVIDSLPFPCFMVPGNHDRDVWHGPKAAHNALAAESAEGLSSRPRDLTTWRRTVGYVDTAFFRGNVRFILMNNVRRASAGMTDYTGGLTEKQKHWLDSVLHVVAAAGSGREAGKPRGGEPALTILATHIPVSQMKGLDSLLALIPEPERMLFVAGHTHYVERGSIGIGPDNLESAVVDSGSAIPEIIVGATCGSWWRGVKDADGVPYALQSCGAPRGYFLADIGRGGKCRLSYKCVGRPAGEQLSVWACRDVSETDSEEASDTAPFHLYVNVFGGAPDGRVEFSVPMRLRRAMRIAGEGKRVPGRIRCQKSSSPAPEVEEVVRYNASMTRDYRKSHRDEFIPLRRKPSTHLWQSPMSFSGAIPAYMTVRYRDEYMKIRAVNVPVRVLDDVR